jgi:hypothetical protein
MQKNELPNMQLVLLLLHTMIPRFSLLSRLFLLSPLMLVPVLAPGQERSWKRGVSANVLSPEQVEVLAPGVSWVYNWGATPGRVESGDQMEFLPMVWGQSQSTLDAVKAYLDGGATPSTILALNEPNLAGQAFITPEASANWMTAVHDDLERYGLPLIGPQMSLGSAPSSSITAYDPIEQREVTYTTMEQFLDAFDYYLEDKSVIDGISVHPYGNAGELKWAVELAYQRYGKPVWVTEFAYWDAADAEAEYAYMVEVLDFLEHSPMVARYAWFKADLGSRDKLSLLESRGATLTPLGELYVNYPVHDPDFYYPVPGRVEAEAYVAQENFSIAVAETKAGMGALYGGRNEAWSEYQIDVAEAGRYRLRVRISSSFLDPLPDDYDNGEMNPPSGIERDLYYEVDLDAGPQTFRFWALRFSAKIDWLEFKLLTN